MRPLSPARATPGRLYVPPEGEHYPGSTCLFPCCLVNRFAEFPRYLGVDRLGLFA